MIELNLTPEEFRKEEVKGFQLPGIVSPKSLLGLFVVLLIFEALFWGYMKFFAEGKLNSIKDQMGGLSANLGEVRGMRDRVSQAQQVSRDLSKRMDEPYYWTDLLQELSDSVIPGIWIQHLSPSEVAVLHEEKMANGTIQTKKEMIPALMVKGRVSVRGDEASVVGEFLRLLKEKPANQVLLEDLYLDQISKAKETGSQGVYEFKLIGVIKEEHRSAFKGIEKR